MDRRGRVELREAEHLIDGGQQLGPLAGAREVLRERALRAGTGLVGQVLIRSLEREQSFGCGVLDCLWGETGIEQRRRHLDGEHGAVRQRALLIWRDQSDRCQPPTRSSGHPASAATSTGEYVLGTTTS
jgi:hypothetical protein